MNENLEKGRGEVMRGGWRYLGHILICSPAGRVAIVKHNSSKSCNRETHCSRLKVFVFFCKIQPQAQLCIILSTFSDSYCPSDIATQKYNLFH